MRLRARNSQTRDTQAGSLNASMHLFLWSFFVFSMDVRDQRTPHAVGQSEVLATVEKSIPREIALWQDAVIILPHLHTTARSSPRTTHTIKLSSAEEADTDRIW